MADDGWSFGDLVPNELKNFFNSQPARVLDKYRNDKGRLDPNNVTPDTLRQHGIDFGSGDDPYAEEARNQSANSLRFANLNRDLIKSSMQPPELSWNQWLGGALQAASVPVGYAQGNRAYAEGMQGHTILDKHMADTNEAQRDLREAMLKSTLEGTHGAQDAWMKFSQSRLQKKMDLRQKAAVIAARADDPAQGARAAEAYLRMQGDTEGADAVRQRAPKMADPMPVAPTAPPPPVSSAAPAPMAPAPEGGPPPYSGRGPGAPQFASAMDGLPQTTPLGPGVAEMDATQPKAMPPAGPMIAPPPPKMALGAAPEDVPPPTEEIPASAYAAPNQQEVTRLQAKARRLLDQEDEAGAKQATHEADMAAKRWNLSAPDKSNQRLWVDTWGQERPKPYLPDAPNAARMAAENGSSQQYYDYLVKTKGKGYAERVKGMANYDLQPPNPSRGNADILGDVQIYAGGRGQIYDQTKFANIAPLRKEYAQSGLTGRGLTSANTVMKHIGDAWDLIPELKSSDIPGVTHLAQGLHNLTGDKSQQEIQQRLDIAYTHIADELDTALKMGHATVSGIEGIKANLNRFAPPAKQRAALAQSLAMLGDRVEAVKESYHRDLGPVMKDNNWQGLGPKARFEMSRIINSPAFANTGYRTDYHPDPTPWSQAHELKLERHKDDPKARADFDEKYGEGAAKAALGETDW